MHIHYDYTVFDMINCQEYIIAVLVKLLFFFFKSTEMTTRTKQRDYYDYFPIQRIFL